MCGIFGYVGNRKAGKILLEGLKRLEYRGYDSMGIAVIENDELRVIKDVGKIDEINKKLHLENVGGRIGISHTRWATHGGVTRINAHPHVSCDESIAVVHNGIIENYQQLKKELSEKGHAFKSQTDTEIIPHMLEEFYKKTKDPLKAVLETVKKLKGSFAFLVLFKDYPDRILVARYKSPLVIGVGDGEAFVASDVPAFLKYTNKVIFLDEMEVAVVKRDGVEVYDGISGKRKEKEVVEVDWNLEQAEKAGYPHFMIKEIMEQKESLLRVLGQDENIMKAVEMLKHANKIFVVAAGTSYHAGLVARYWFVKLAGVDLNVIVASEFPHFKNLVDKNSVVIAISQSGETADVLEAVRESKKRDAKVIAVVNVMGSTLMRLADLSLLINAGPEICVVATKSYTSQLSLLGLLAHAFVGKLEEGKEKLKEMQKKVKEFLENENNLKLAEDLAENLKDKQHIFLIGRELSYVTALEGALKIKEVSYIHAEGFAGGELKHGTLALIEDGIPCIAISPLDKTRDEILSNAMEIKARGGKIIGISEENNEVFDEFIKVPKLNGNVFHPIMMIIPIQLVSYYLAVKRGYDPDKPRNLAKSVTVK
ncbi:MAG: glutamine--fructose-6-phosphate transaminase (isomerizing) [Candidatus Aenigmarchaeota archaeon]|nr:glutamine--fructose-6-phosphate transaminase (isomerizing) [Candidatus Aenigmarchaeota archaeon]